MATVVGSATPLMLAALREQARVQQGRNPQPSPGIIDSQSVKGADTAGRDSRGYDAGKKINGKQRFIVTDTLGLLIVVVVLAASVQDLTVPGPPCSRRTWRNARSP